MALVNKIDKKGSLNSKKLFRAIQEARYDSKYHENYERLQKSISLKRDLNRNGFN